MVSVIDKSGVMQDVEPYRQRIVIPPDKGVLIRSYVQQRENELNLLTPKAGADDSRPYPPDFKKKMEGFLTIAAYSGNLLRLPYAPSETTMRQMLDFWRYFLPFNSFFHEQVSESMYNLEKMVRLGLVDRFKEEVGSAVDSHQAQEILAVENSYYRYGDIISWGQLIKMLSRHKVLGLPDIDGQRKDALQRAWFDDPSIKVPGNMWIDASAKRAGFRLPPILAESLDETIKTWIEQDPTLLERKLEYKCLGNPEFREKIEADRDGFVFYEYISTMHHLHRLLDPDGS